MNRIFYLSFAVIIVVLCVNACTLRKQELAPVDPALTVGTPPSSSNLGARGLGDDAIEDSYIEGSYIVMLKDEAIEQRTLAPESASVQGVQGVRGASDTAAFEVQVSGIIQDILHGGSSRGTDETSNEVSNESSSASDSNAINIQPQAMRASAAVDYTPLEIVNGFSLENVDSSVAERFAADERVAYIEPDQVIRLNAVQNNPTWGLDRIDGRNLPLNSQYHYQTTGRGVHAYVIDSGLNTNHSEFRGRIGNGFSLFNTVEDCNGHGTHAAGIIGGTTLGVAKEVTIHPLRVFDCEGNGTVSGVVEALGWIERNYQLPAVVNLSLVSNSSAPLDEAVAKTIAKGITLVAAAGNYSKNACDFSPARLRNTITVGASSSNDSFSNFSNRGGCVDIIAPGTQITSAWIGSANASNVSSGTSQASPFVAGVAALYLEANPNAPAASVQQAILNNASQNVIRNLPAGTPNRLLFSQIARANTPNRSPSANFSATPNAGTAPLTVQFDASSSSDPDNDPLQYHWFFADGTNAQGVRVQHSFSQAGNYNVTLQVSDGQLLGQKTQSILVYQGGTSSSNTGNPCPSCQEYTGNIATTGQFAFQPNGNYYYAPAGTQRAFLQAADNVDLELELYAWNNNGWSRVATSTNSGSSEVIVYNGKANYYVWRVASYRGAGNYRLFLDTP